MVGASVDDSLAQAKRPKLRQDTLEILIGEGGLLRHIAVTPSTADVPPRA